MFLENIIRINMSLIQVLKRQYSKLRYAYNNNHGYFILI